MTPYEERPRDEMAKRVSARQRVPTRGRAVVPAPKFSARAQVLTLWPDLVHSAGGGQDANHARRAGRAH